MQKFSYSILVADNLKIVSAWLLVSFLEGSKLKRFFAFDPYVQTFGVIDRLSNQHVHIPLNGLAWIVNVLICLYIK